MAKVLDLTVQLSCIMQGNFSGQFSSAAKSIEQMQQKITALTSTQNSIKSFQNAQEKLAGNIEKYNTQTQALARYGTQLNILKQQRAAYNRVLQKAEKAEDTKKVTQYTAAIAKLTKQIKELENKRKSLNSTNSTLASRIDQQKNSLDRMRDSLSRAGVDTERLASSQDKLQRELEQTTQAQTKLQNAQSRLAEIRENLSWGNIRGQVTAAIGTFEFLRKPIQVSMDFEAAMQRVRAAGFSDNPNAPEFDLLREQAIKLGAATKFTAVQAAQAQEMLIRAGYKAQDVLKAMPALLDMSAAEDIALDVASTIIAGISSAYGYDAGQTQRLADVLANTSRNAMTNITELGDMMGKAAPIASQLRIPIEDAAAHLGALRQANIELSTAGTSYRNGLMRLASIANNEKVDKHNEPTDVGVRTLAGLNVPILHENGHMIRIEEILERLNTALLKKYGADADSKRVAVLQDIFGQRNGAVWAALMKMSSDRDASGTSFVERLRTSNYTEAQGRAGIMANINLDTLSGQLTLFQSAWAGFQQRIGDMFKPEVRKVIEALTAGLTKINELITEFPSVSQDVVFFLTSIAALPVGKGLVNLVKNLIQLPGAIINVTKAAAGYDLATGAASATTMALTWKIYLLIGALYLLFKYWGQISATFQNMGNVIKADPAFKANDPSKYKPGTADYGIAALNSTYAIPSLAPREKHAQGGILTSPHIGLVAEDGPEAIIPLTKRSRGIQVLMQAAEKLGLIRESNTFTSSSTSNISTITERGNNDHGFGRNTGITLRRDGDSNNSRTFSPVVNISVNAAESESRDNNSLAELISSKVRDILEEIANNAGRLSYA